MQRDHGLPHSHENQNRMGAVFILIVVYMVIEVIAGFATKSLALLADAGHMLTDAGAIGLALLAMGFARRPATQKNTYGFYRMEILAALINAVILLGISFYILYEAWERFKNPPAIQSIPMLIVATIGLGVNLFSMKLLHAQAEHNLNIKAAYLEVLSDMLASIGVIAASLIMIFTHWYYADPLISAGIGLFILPRTWNLLNQSVHILLEGTPLHIKLDEVEAAIQSVDGVKAIHDLHVWTITSGIDSLSAHIAVDVNAHHHKILTALQELLQARFKISHTTIQLEEERCKQPGC